MGFHLGVVYVQHFRIGYVVGFLGYFPSSGKRETWPVDHRWAETIPV